MALPPRLHRIAHRLECKAGWDDLALPAGEVTLLRQIAAAVSQRKAAFRQERGGLCALFWGADGASKTLAAKVLASESGMDLYRIDLADVVSKYVGEAEKKLKAVFAVAEDSNAILFFDEADALFGRRSNVKDSHDRYANSEIGYLLQRMEAYDGLVILATNRKSALAPAFLRRLRFVVRFPRPGTAERRSSWGRLRSRPRSSDG